MDKEHYLISRLSSSHIGDDGAVIGEWSYSSDAFCEDTHFLREWMTPAQIGRKAMLINISDAVAMNADPRYALLTISLPRTITKYEINELSHSIEKCASEYGCEIIGGDTVGGDKLHISITLISHTLNPLYRTGIKEGDLLAYTGILGESKRDLEALMDKKAIAPDSKFYEPVLRRDFIKKARSYIRAGMDISDGLFCDCNKMLDINKCGIELLSEIPEEIGSSGEEYEMLIAFSPDNLEKLKEIATECNTQLTVFAKAAENSQRFPCSSHHF